MPNSFHRDLVLDDVHALTARTYADLAARDGDSAFHGDAANVNKIVRVESPLSFFVLAATTPTFVSFMEAGDVLKVGTTVDNQVGVWTGDGTIEGNAGLTFDGAQLNVGARLNVASALTVGGSLDLSLIQTASDVDTDDEVIIGITGTGSPITITILTEDIVFGRVFIIKDEGGGAQQNNITIATEGSQTIDGDATASISSNYGVLRLYSDGGNLFSW